MSGTQGVPDNSVPPGAYQRTIQFYPAFYITSDAEISDIKKAAEEVPKEPAIWITAAKLEESNGNGEMAGILIEHGLRTLQREGVEIDREACLREAEAAERAGSPATCAGIVCATIGHGVEEEDRKQTWIADAEECVERGSVETARAIYPHSLAVFPGEESIWIGAAQLELDHGTRDSLDALLRLGFTYQQAEEFWLTNALFKSHTGDASGARAILEEAHTSIPDSQQIAAFILYFDNLASVFSDDLLARVFSFLEIRDVAIAACVCRSWRQLSLREMPGKRLDTPSSCIMPVHTFLDILRRNPGLEELNLVWQSQLLEDPAVLQACSELRNLQSLNLWWNGGPVDFFGNSAVESGRWPSLRSLGVLHCKFSVDRGDPCVALPSLQELEITNSELTTPVIRCERLTRLEFLGCKFISALVDDTTLDLRLDTPALEILEFGNCDRVFEVEHEVTDRGDAEPVRFIRHEPYPFGVDDLRSLQSEMCPSLRVLAVTGCPDVPSTPNLLQGTELGVTPPVVHPAGPAVPGSSSLDLTGVPQISRHVFLELLSDLREQLEDLNMGDHSLLLNDPEVLKVCWDLPLLQSLTVGEWKDSRRPMEEPMGLLFGNNAQGHWRSLRRLHIRSWGSGFLHEDEPCVALPDLRELHVAHNYTSVRLIIQCDNLTLLTISWFISKPGGRDLQLSTPKLEVLEFQQCMVPDSDLLVVASSCPNLRTLRKIKCWKNIAAAFLAVATSAACCIPLEVVPIDEKILKAWAPDL